MSPVTADAEARMRGSIMFCVTAAAAGMYAYWHIAVRVRNAVATIQVSAWKAHTYKGAVSAAPNPGISAYQRALRLPAQSARNPPAAMLSAAGTLETRPITSPACA